MFSEKTRIVIVPTDDSHIRNFRIPNVLIKLAVTLIICIVLGIGFVIWEYSNKVIDENRLTQLEIENKILESKVRSFKEKVSYLQLAMSKYSEFDRKIRLLVDLPEEEQDVRRAGVGGPFVPDSLFEALNSLDVEGASAVKSVEQDVEQLIREVKFQEISFKNIIKSIEIKQNLWDHTPSIRPVAKDLGLKVSGFGMRKDPFTGKLRMHDGIDFAARRGTPIFATADGKVVAASKRAGYGLTVQLDHGYGYSTLYAHCSIIKVKTGDKVKRGQIIALVGNTGRSTGPHVHYEVRVTNRAVNPEKYILPDVVTD